MKIKMILMKKKANSTQRRPLKFLNATKTARFLMPRALEIAFRELLDFIFFSGGGGGHAPDPLGERRLSAHLLVVTAAYYTSSGRL